MYFEDAFDPNHSKALMANSYFLMTWLIEKRRTQLVFAGGHEHLNKLRQCKTAEASRLVGYTENEILKSQGKPFKVIVFQSQGALEGKAATLDHVLDVLVPRVDHGGDMTSGVHSNKKSRLPSRSTPRMRLAADAKAKKNA